MFDFNFFEVVMIVFQINLLEKSSDDLPYLHVWGIHSDNKLTQLMIRSEVFICQTDNYI